MKGLLAILFILGIQSLHSQSRLSRILEEVPADSNEGLATSTNFHSAVRPYILNSREQTEFLSLPLLKSRLNLKPLIDLNSGYHLGELAYRTGAGAELSSNFDSKWYFRASAVAGQGLSNEFTRSDALVSDSSLTGTYNYLDIRGRVSFSPNSIFNFQAGLDENFIGEGVRSLLLSDYGKAYPFAQIRANFWKLDYSVLYQFFRERSDLNEDLNKFAATHYLSFNATKWLNIGIFESVIFQPKDSTLNRGFEAEYLNPLIFYRPQEYSLGSADNVLLGLNISAKIKKHKLYGQLLLDEFLLSEIRAGNGWWANKFAVQGGIKGFVGKKWMYRVESNLVRPYTYSHSSLGQNYGHSGEELAHPLGANFAEILGELKWQQDRWLIRSLCNFQYRGQDSLNTNYGIDIYKDYNSRPFDYGHSIGQFSPLRQINLMLSVHYTLERNLNLQVFIENHLRSNGVSGGQYSFIAGIRTVLWNDYRNY